MNPAPKPEPHPGAAALAIAVMAVAVAVVLGVTGLGGRLDVLVAEWVKGFGLEGGLRPLEPWICWVWTILMTMGICQAVLHSVRNWRRWVLVGTSLVLTLGWIPVLALAGYAPPVTIPLIALLWGGIGALIYAARHREPVIEPVNPDGRN